jgi:hypothetical protein
MKYLFIICIPCLFILNRLSGDPSGAFWDIQSLGNVPEVE